jgi:hypothetical protein
MRCQSLGTKSRHVLQAQPDDRDRGISFTTLHLESEAHEWWHHGLVTLGHSRITSYWEFTERLIDRFDRRDPETHFRDLA